MDWSKYRLKQEVLDSNVQYIDGKTGKVIFYSGFEGDTPEDAEKRNTITIFV